MRYEDNLLVDMDMETESGYTLGYLIDAVPLGATILDELTPGWAELINTDVLDLSYGSTCICGQIAAKGTFGYSEWITLATAVRDISFDRESLVPLVTFCYPVLTSPWLNEIGVRMQATT
jgi:hypothetical protein